MGGPGSGKKGRGCVLVRVGSVSISGMCPHDEPSEVGEEFKRDSNC